MGGWLERWAAETPDAIAIAERLTNGDWRRVNWAQLRNQVGRVVQSLPGLELASHAPVIILSDDSIDHLLMMLAAIQLSRVPEKDPVA